MDNNLKRRAWSKSDKRMYYDNKDTMITDRGIIFVRKDLDINNDSDVWNGDISNNNIRFIRNTYIDIMEFTGYYDADGKEIYEGDIFEIKFEKLSYLAEDKNNLKWYKCYGYVERQCEGYGYVLQSDVMGEERSLSNLINDFNARKDLMRYYINLTTFKIVGNVYTNPELLDIEPILIKESNND